MSAIRSAAWADVRLREHAAIPLFAGCTARELRRIGQVATRLEVAPDTFIVRQGQRPGQFVVVLDGIADVRRNGLTIDAIGAGGHVGEIALVRRLDEPADVVARTALTVDVVAPREFVALRAEIDRFRARVDDVVDDRLARWIRASLPPWSDAPTALVP